MAKIHELPTILANQIAAGEVVERPASVVKELVENAIDANSTEINITIENSGLKLIKIVDDGDGIDPTEVKTAFLRHATSKISEQRDLFRVRSLGFRGEALPSISSVAKVRMQTSTGNEGVEVDYQGGKLVSEKPAEARKGTTIEVSSLFYNTPARLKYMSSPNTELARISDMVNRLAVSHPEVAFSLTSNGKELLRTSGRDNLLQVLGAIYGMKTVSKMVKISASDLDIQVNGYVSLPELTRASRNYISLILNGRYIKNFGLTKAVISGYGSKLMIGRYPISVIEVNVDPALIDVNVHPTKQEVRISNETAISRLVYQAISTALADKRLIPDAAESFKQSVPTSSVVETTLVDTNETASSTVTQPVKVTEEDSRPYELPDELTEPIIVNDRRELDTSEVHAFEGRLANEPDSLPVFVDIQAPSELSIANDSQPLKPQQERLAEIDENHFESGFPDLNYIGQVHGTYLIAETAEGMFLVDQHAAQERVNYEYYRQKIGEVSPDQQNLLVPIILDYSTTDYLLITEKLSILQELGIYLEDFGQNSFIVHHHPMWFKEGQEESTLKEMIDWILNDQKISVAAFREKTAIMMSCKRAIKANHHLDERQAKALLKRLPECENPYNCPHGRPVLVKFTNEDIEKMFKRIQDPHNTKESMI
ncbi:DNA mismatch repair endonuclease MutL [Lentilactobacillus sp. SPB1-3]|uniref:DNA mismatch repair endonuclease MutL n=1 Tax=Lentilactobacillus terminaliae TaxID=3003483 RepID=A0ACD5DCY1_9LACO|nr:DNA mismatch repair endonuclease MutL [Lentilactobacillus sp. SPB1-3]MCZ0977374.1 DNA mismatch repair endonuclease MutL [Lentilactobacillus sp. SPB1-3]